MSIRVPVFTLLMILLGAPAWAHQLTAPASVVADGAGHFSFTIVVELTSPAYFGSEYGDGTDNTDLGEWWADGFCMAEWAAGFHSFRITGRLEDPYRGGSVYVQEVMCDGWSGEATVVIEAPTVSTAPVSWSSLKAQYR